MALLRSETRIYGNATVDTFLKVDGNNIDFPATSNSTGALRVSGGIGVKGNVFSSGNITALNADLGNLVVANYVTGTLTTANQYSITNVGTLGNVTVTNSANVGTLNAGDGVFTGNLIVSGNVVYANVSTLNIKDPIIEQGGNTDGSPLTLDDNKDRGSLLHYYDGTAIDAFMGWDNSNAEFAFGSNVSVTGEVVTFNSYGNIRANYFLGNILGSADSAQTVTGNSQPNITSVGTLNYLNVSNLSGGNGIVTANYFVGTLTTGYQPNITSLGTLSNLTVTGPVNLGNVANLTIYGGNDGQYLKTDGNGILSWATVTSGNANISGSNTQLFFNDANSNTLGTSANLTFNKSSNTLTVDKIVANGALLTNINGSNVVGEVAFAAIANSVAGSNVSGNVSFAIQSHYANIANSVSGTNVSGNVASAVQSHYANIANSVAGTNVSGNVSSAIQSHYANIANSVTGSNVSGNVDSSVQSHYANIANSVAGSNVSGNVTSAVQSHYANIANAVTFANVSDKPTTISGYGITDAYSNTNTAAYLVTYTGNLTAGNANLGNAVVANYFVGNGSLLTGITSSYGNSNVATYLSTYTGNLTAGNINLSYTTTSTANLGNAVVSNYYIGNGYLLSSVYGGNVFGNVNYAIISNWANVANSVTYANVSDKPTTISGYGITDAYSNTNAGAYLSSYTGDISGANLTLTGNLLVGGTLTTVNSTTTRVVDPIMEQGGGANGTALSSNDGKDRGTLLHYYTGSSAVDAFMGWDNSNAEFAFGSNVTIASEVATFNTFGNIRAGNAVFSNLVTANYFTGTLTTAAQPNITSIGTLTSLAVTGNISAGNANLGNLVTANYFSGDGSLLTGIASSYGNSNVATYLAAYTGNLSASNISFNGANVSLGNVSNLHITGGTNGYFLKTDGSGNLSWGAQSSLTATADQFTANGTDTTFTLSVTPAGKTFTVVAIQGVLQPKSSYSLSGPQLTFDFSPPATALIEVTTFGGSIAAGGGGGGGSALTVSDEGSSLSTATTSINFVGSGVTATNVGDAITVTINSSGGGGSGNFVYRTYTGDGVANTFTVTSGVTANSVLVAENGILQRPTTDYTIAGTTLTLVTTPAIGVDIQIRELSSGTSNNSSSSLTWNIASSNATMVANNGYFVDTTGGAKTMTLPSSATLGDTIRINDLAGSFATNNLTVSRNGHKIQGIADNLLVDADQRSFGLVYSNSTYGWKVLEL